MNSPKELAFGNRGQSKMDRYSPGRMRKRFRAWKSNLRLKAESERYRKLFEMRGLLLPDDHAIREAMRPRFPRVRTKQKGELSIIAIYHHYNWENECLKPALEKFGTVRHYDWFARHDHSKRDWGGRKKAEMNTEMLLWIKSCFQQKPADAVFAYLSGELATSDTIREMRSLEVPLINLSLNDKEAFVGKIRDGEASGVRDICRYFDISWTSTEDALEKYCVEGGLPIYLPEGATPEVHRPYPLERSIDVSFVGQCYGNRPVVINSLRDRGIQVEAYGYGWPNGPLSTDEMVRMYSRSNINLGFGSVAGHKDTYCLKGRDFEIPMSRGLYLTEYNRELERFYKAGEEITIYRDFEDLVSKIHDLLANPEKAEAIRQKGYERAQKEHSWEMRFEKIFRLCGLVDT